MVQMNLKIVQTKKNSSNGKIIVEINKKNSSNGQKNSSNEKK